MKKASDVLTTICYMDTNPTQLFRPLIHSCFLYTSTLKAFQGALRHATYFFPFLLMFPSLSFRQKHSCFLRMLPLAALKYGNIMFQSSNSIYNSKPGDRRDDFSRSNSLYKPNTLLFYCLQFSPRCLSEITDNYTGVSSDLRG